jgi:hypothetical protein
MDALLAAVSAVVGNTNSILVKGSRFMKMERVSSHIVALATNDKHISNNKISINNENNNNKEASHVA